MNKYFKEIGKSLAVGSLLLSTMNGCTEYYEQDTDCVMRNNDPDSQRDYSPQDALRICEENNQRILKCVKVGDGMTDTAHEEDVNCSDGNLGGSLSNLYSDADAVYCIATEHPEKVTVVCVTK